MSEHRIISEARDEYGTWYELDDNAPLNGITVDETNNRVRLDYGDGPDPYRTLGHLMALERDRMLGYSEGELHTDPLRIVVDAVSVLESKGQHPEELIMPEDREKLGLD
jgi:hypothetical protein